jgi:hypothetical protein
MCALTLAALAASPFTAPFSTCDLGILVAGNAVHRNEPAEIPSRATSIADAAFFLASVDVTTESMKNLALAPTALPPMVSGVPTARRSLRNMSSERVPFGLLSSPVLRI